MSSQAKQTNAAYWVVLAEHDNQRLGGGTRSVSYTLSIENTRGYQVFSVDQNINKLNLKSLLLFLKRLFLGKKSLEKSYGLKEVSPNSQLNY